MRYFSRWVFVRAPGMHVPQLSWPVSLFIILALHLFAVQVLTALTFNNSPEAYYPKDAAAVQLRDKLRQDFPGDEVLTVLFSGDDLYGPEFLRGLNVLVAQLRRNPSVDRVTTITTLERISGSSEGFAVEPLISAQRIGVDAPEAIRARVLSDRFAPGALASRDGRHVAVVVRPVAMTSSGQRLGLSVDVARAINDAGLRGRYAGEAGPVSMDVIQLESILSDTGRFVPLTVLIALVLLAWVVGRWRPVAVGAVAMSTVVMPSVSVIAVSGQPYTMASAILPSLLAAYTVVTLLHLYAGIQRAQGSAASPAAAVDAALHETLRPALFNVLTTSAGLLSLLLVPIPPIQVFGAVGALGTLVVFLTVYGLMPPLLVRFAGPAWPRNGSGLGVLGRFDRHITHFSIRHPKAVLLVCCTLVAAAVPTAMKVNVETDMLAFFAEDHEINVHTRRIESALVGTTSLVVSLESPDRDAFQSVATLRAVKGLQDWLDAQPEIDRTGSMVELVEEMHWAMNRERSTFRTLPPTDRLLRQYLLVYDGDDLYELVNRDFSHTQIVLSLNVHGTEAIRGVIDRIRLHAEANPIAGVTLEVGGYGRLLADQIDLLVSGQTKSFAGAFAQIFLIMALLWRSPKGAALCMVPNLAPLFFIFVLMGALAIRLDSATVMIASVVLGITVDDTIHLFHGFRRRLQAGLSPVYAIARSYEATGRAVMATSFILVGQFLLLAMSDFVPTANFGLMTATGLLAGLIFELLLLPALLVLGYGSAQRVARSVRRDVVDVPDSVVVDQRPRQVLVCKGERCRDKGALTVWRRLRTEQDSGGLPLRLASKRCLGPCEQAPVIQVYPEGVSYGPMVGPKLERVVKEHLRRGAVVDSLARVMPKRPTDSV